MKHLPHCLHQSGAVPAELPCHCADFYALVVATSDLLRLVEHLGGHTPFVDAELDRIKQSLGDWFNMGLLRIAEAGCER